MAAARFPDHDDDGGGSHDPLGPPEGDAAFGAELGYLARTQYGVAHGRLHTRLALLATWAGAVQSNAGAHWQINRTQLAAEGQAVLGHLSAAEPKLDQARAEVREGHGTHQQLLDEVDRESALSRGGRLRRLYADHRWPAWLHPGLMAVIGGAEYPYTASVFLAVLEDVRFGPIHFGYVAAAGAVVMLQVLATVVGHAAEAIRMTGERGSPERRAAFGRLVAGAVGASAVICALVAMRVHVAWEDHHLLEADAGQDLTDPSSMFLVATNLGLYVGFFLVAALVSALTYDPIAGDHKANVDAPAERFQTTLAAVVGLYQRGAALPGKAQVVHQKLVQRCVVTEQQVAQRARVTVDAFVGAYARPLPAEVLQLADEVRLPHEAPWRTADPTDGIPVPDEQLLARFTADPLAGLRRDHTPPFDPGPGADRGPTHEEPGPTLEPEPVLEHPPVGPGPIWPVEDGPSQQPGPDSGPGPLGPIDTTPPAVPPTWGEDVFD